MKRVLYDTNVILDVLLEREPLVAASARVLDATGRGKVEGYIAGHAFTTLAYFLQRRFNSAEKVKKELSHLLQKTRVAPVTDMAIRQAMTSPIRDFEDAVTHAAALEAGVSVIVTRNARDFAKGTIPAVLPEVFQAE